MSETREPLLAKQVEIAKIESEVNAMWAAAANPTGLLPPVMRACVMNLVIYAPDRAGADTVNDILTRMVQRHPSRYILLCSDKSTPGSDIEAYVSAICQLPQPDRRQICCEQITLVAEGPTADQLQTTVLGILAADVPMVLWWRAEAEPNKVLFKELAEAADYVILDSAFFQQPFALWRELHRAFPQTIFGDLNWARVRPWRDLVAQFFDMPDTNPLLYQIEKATLTYSAHGDNRIPTQAFLLLGWLGTRLDWEFVKGKEIEPGNFDLELRRGDQPIHVEIRSQEAGYARTGRLLGCALETVHGPADASGENEALGCEFVVTRRVKEDLIHTRMYLLDRGELACATSLEVRQEHELVMMELDRPGRHPILEQSLDFCANLMERIQ